MEQEKEWWNEQKYRVGCYECSDGYDPKALITEAERLGRKKGIEECMEVVESEQKPEGACNCYTCKSDYGDCVTSTRNGLICVLSANLHALLSKPESTT